MVSSTGPLVATGAIGLGGGGMLDGAMSLVDADMGGGMDMDAGMDMGGGGGMGMGGGAGTGGALGMGLSVEFASGGDGLGLSQLMSRLNKN